MEPNTSPVMPPPPVSPTPPKSSLGPVVGIILVIFVLALGGLYFWGAELSKEATAPTSENTPPPTSGDQITTDLETQSDSDDIESIDADLKSSNYEGIDQDATAVEAFF